MIMPNLSLDTLAPTLSTLEQWTRTLTVEEAAIKIYYFGTISRCRPSDIKPFPSTKVIVKCFRKSDTDLLFATPESLP